MTAQEQHVLSQQLYQAYGQNPLIQSFLAKRGLSIHDVDYLLHPNPSHQHDPFLLRGVHEFIDLLYDLKCRGEKFAVIPDYDADGVLSGTVARVGLSLFGFGDVYVYPPKTFDGYGLSKRSVNAVMKAQPDTTVILTTDNGSNARDGIAYAKSLGLTVLVTDHHLAKADPPADAVVNPNRYIAGETETYPFKAISGTAVIYKVLQAYGLKYVTDKNILAQFESLIFLVGISAISDVMPMLDENRYFVSQSVKMLEQAIATHTPERVFQYDDSPLGQYYRGVDLLIYTLNCHKKLNYGVNSDTFGFTIGPMLNSPRRMIGRSDVSFDLFQTKQQDLFNTQFSLPSDVLYNLNEERKAYVKKLTRALFERVERVPDGMIPDPIHYVVFNAVTGAGIAGLLAAAFTKRYRLPSVAFAVPHMPSLVSRPTELINVDVLGQKSLSGSARAPEGFDLHALLAEIDSEHPGLITKWGGHEGAAGITIPAENFDTFRRVFAEKVLVISAQSVDLADDHVVSLPIQSEYVITTDIYDHMVNVYGRPESCEEIRVSSHTSMMAHRELVDFVRFYERLEPFGHGFPKPSFSVVVSMQDVRVFTMGANKQHAKLILPNGLSIIHWNGADIFAFDATPDEQGNVPMDDRVFLVTGELSINEYNGYESLQIVADDVQAIHVSRG